MKIIRFLIELFKKTRKAPSPSLAAGATYLQFPNRSTFLPCRPASRHCGIPGFPNFTFTLSRKGNIFLIWPFMSFDLLSRELRTWPAYSYIGPRWTVTLNIYFKGHLVRILSPKHRQTRTHTHTAGRLLHTATEWSAKGEGVWLSNRIFTVLYINTGFEVAVTAGSSEARCIYIGGYGCRIGGEAPKPLLMWGLGQNPRKFLKF